MKLEGSSFPVPFRLRSVPDDGDDDDDVDNDNDDDARRFLSLVQVDTTTTSVAVAMATHHWLMMLIGSSTSGNESPPVIDSTRLSSLLSIAVGHFLLLGSCGTSIYSSVSVSNAFHRNAVSKLDLLYKLCNKSTTRLTVLHAV